MTLRAAKNEIEGLWAEKKTQLLQQLKAKQAGIKEAERSTKEKQEAVERAKKKKRKERK
ncbi:MAG: hypothetical protein IPH16_13945 [Haliscomenobacter sp.]|nr:hypothetical protein [Haliscomenobacter sp.]